MARELHYRSSSGARRPGEGGVLRPGGGRRTRRILVGGARQVVVMALLPLWPFVAYPLSLAAHGSRRPRRSLRSRGRLMVPNPGMPSMPSRMLHSVVRHPVVVALGAPMRFVASRTPFRSAWSGRDDRGGGWLPPNAGDREPRRPKPGPPVDAIALPEPRG